VELVFQVVGITYVGSSWLLGCRGKRTAFQKQRGRFCMQTAATERYSTVRAVDCWWPESIQANDSFGEILELQRTYASFDTKALRGLQSKRGTQLHKVRIWSPETGHCFVWQRSSSASYPVRAPQRASTCLRCLRCDVDRWYL